ncbi:N-acetylmuramoyl-L-alanine amidase [Egicoccus halophilus]|uniref:N-acetylmuramoyl-L-alanine amidase n=1 Tax=Egicoccus halophilus TaxID=1670830 RepID=A0A8J3A537_9ACTN|nr:N-acetylmuramoyl-L-alanine amidase [Egicoccus halophilus]GGI03151.1 N-acetylmuramoyl-L-alanine amidase [Egicoccus halophilus]
MELIQLGSAGPEVEDVQQRLGDLGLPCDDDRGVFDATTLAAVRAFQQQRGLPADGMVGPDTWHALVGASWRLGDRMLYVKRPVLQGDDVRDLQRRLNQLGFDAGYEDGLYGMQTFEAVRDFQLNVGLNNDGIAGPDTVDLLRRLYRRHQEAPAYAVREREQLRNAPRHSVAGVRVMVDAGHSPELPGFRNPDGVEEHQVTWAIATLVEGRLAALGAHVVLARGPATSPTPSDRAQHANREDVEAILSIHCNGLGSPAARGAAAYYFGHQGAVSERGRRLAQLAVDRVVEVTGTLNCRTHPSTTALLRESKAPAVLVEPGFLTHPEEGRALADPGYQRELASALVDALVEFLTGAREPVAA